MSVPRSNFNIIKFTKLSTNKNNTRIKRDVALEQTLCLGHIAGYHYLSLIPDQAQSIGNMLIEQTILFCAKYAEPLLVIRVIA